MFLFSDIISTQKLMDFLTQFSNKKLVCFRHFFYFQNLKLHFNYTNSKNIKYLK